MFERYTEKARRVIFFARYEASQVGSPYIETEHLLLGLLREDKWLFRQVLPTANYENVLEEIHKHTAPRKKSATSVDLPLSNESKRVLAYAAEEADRLADRHIGSEHLLLALLREEPSSQLLSQYGTKLAELRLQIAKLPRADAPPRRFEFPQTGKVTYGRDVIELHGARWNVEYIREVVSHYRDESWHWQKLNWTTRDTVIEHSTGSISFDLALVADATKFDLIKAGWKRDYCGICHWRLFEFEGSQSRSGLH